MKGEVLSFDVKPPPPVKFTSQTKEADQKKSRRQDEKQEEKKDETKEENKDAEAKWKFLITIEEVGKITHICAQDGHVVAVGDGGRMRWIAVSKETQKEKGREEEQEEKKERQR
jgi:hypothetical protein